MSAFHPFKPPFRYEDEHAHIIDANGVHVLGISGWDERKKSFVALKHQDSVGELVAKLMNLHDEKEGK